MQPSIGNKPIEIQFEDLPPTGDAIIDCRSIEEYEVSHLDNSIHIPLQQLSLLQDAFPYTKEDTFYVYCRTGNRSSTFVTYLRSIGYKNCQSIAGGYKRWGNSSTC